MSDDNLEVILFEKDGEQYRLSVKEFRDNYYLSIRKWYQDFDGTFKATKEGVTLPYNLHVVARLYEGLTRILSDSETFGELLDVEIDKLPEIHGEDEGS